jgi:hypothetical protein
VSAPEDSFTKLLGRQPTDWERQEHFRARDALGLRNNDALWPLLMMLGHYRTLYAEFPALIARAANDVSDKTRAAAEADLKALGARMQSKLAHSVADTAHKIADRRATTKRLQWVTGCIAVAGVVFSVVGFVGHRAGYSSGHEDGFKEARDESAAAAWANTPEGQVAYRLSKAGSIRDLATCAGRGWVVKGNTCYPHPDGAMVYGWAIARP